jgi:hypothetical protein
VKRYSYGALALLAFGCSPAAATAGGVRIGRADPPPSCEQVSIISATASNTGDDDESVRQNLRARAAARGANYVRLDKLGDSGTIKEYTGTAYKCPSGS